MTVSYSLPPSPGGRPQAVVDAREARLTLPMDLTYVVPLRWMSRDDARFGDLVDYLAALPVAEVVIVDGSPAGIFAAHAARAAGRVRHIPVDAGSSALNGKVSGVLTGVRDAGCDAVVIADDDVRYDRVSLACVRQALDAADVVRPQNYFDPLPWHAALDTARTLINRAVDGDWPGTLGVRRTAIERAGGYDGDVLFENLELVRTVRAAGGRERLARDIYIRRLPPTARHFLSQRVRQAYDEFARPARLACMLAVLPLALALAARRRARELGLLAAVAVAAAEYGRRRDGGARVFPWWTALLAPAWLAERAVCAWLALAARYGLGGVRYSNGRIRRAATPLRILRKHSS